MSGTVDGDGGHLMYKSGIYSEGRLERRPRPNMGVVEEPARSIPIFRDCDVLVVGGGAPVPTWCCWSVTITWVDCPPVAWSSGLIG
jgi:hypothetical protein